MRRWGLGRLATFAMVLLPLATGGCSQACTEIGGTNGVAVSIPTELYVKNGSVSIEVCDGDDCGTTAIDFGKLPGNAGPEERFFTATFADLDREFEPGEVDVRVELRNEKDAVVASKEASVELTRSFPNGKACDGDGYVYGSLALDPADAR